MDRLLDYATIGILAVAVLVGAVTLHSRVISPYLEDRPESVDNWDYLIQGELATGPVNAPITIVEFIDYECPACRIFEDRVKAFKVAHPGAVRSVYRHWPLDIHPSADDAARAVECAHDQGRFTEIHGFLMGSDEWIDGPELALGHWAEMGGVPVPDEFMTCLRSDRFNERIQEDSNLAIAMGGRGTPTLVINGKLLRIMPDSAYLADVLSRSGPARTVSSDVQPASGSEVHQVPLASVTETPIPDLSDTPVWHVDSRPELTLGAYEEPAPEAFGQVMDAAVLRDGRIAVVDAQRHSVVFFESGGAYLGSAGQEGQGPSDLLGPRAAIPTAADSLVIVNRSWVSLVEGPGEVEFLSRLPSPRSFVRGLARGRVVVQELTSMGTRAERTGVRPSVDCFSAWDPIDGHQEDLGCIEYDLSYAFVSGSRQRVVTLPFGVAPQVVVTDDAIVMTRPDLANRLIRLDVETGDSTFIDVPLRPLRVGQAVRREWVDSANAREDDRGLRVDFSRVPFPNTYPLFRQLVSDRAGGFWAELYQPHPQAPGAGWLAFDGSGTVRGRVSTPPDTQLLQVGESFILGLTRDSLGVQYVVRHPLRREADAPG